MAKKLDIEILPPNQMAMKQMVPKAAIESLRFVKKMKEAEVAELLEEARELAKVRAVYGIAGLAIGAHLKKIHDITSPYRGFDKYVKSVGIAPKSAYRAIRGYEAAAQFFHPTILQVAEARGLKMIGYDEKKPLGEYTEIVKHRLPPPKNPDFESAVKYVEDLKKTVTERKARIRKLAHKGELVVGEPDVLLRSAYAAINRYFRRLPNNSRTRMKWVDDLTGMLMSDAGITSARSFSPSAVPEDFKPRPVGRPKVEEGEEAVEAS